MILVQNPVLSEYLSIKALYLSQYYLTIYNRLKKTAPHQFIFLESEYLLKMCCVVNYKEHKWFPEHEICVLYKMVFS